MLDHRHSSRRLTYAVLCYLNPINSLSIIIEASLRNETQPYITKAFLNKGQWVTLVARSITMLSHDTMLPIMRVSKKIMPCIKWLAQRIKNSNLGNHRHAEISE